MNWKKGFVVFCLVFFLLLSVFLVEAGDYDGNATACTAAISTTAWDPELKCCEPEDRGTIVKLNSTGAYLFCYHGEGMVGWKYALSDRFKIYHIDGHDYVSNSEKWFECNGTLLWQGIPKPIGNSLYQRDAAQFLCVKHENDYKFYQCCDPVAASNDGRGCAIVGGNNEQVLVDRIKHVGDSTFDVLPSDDSRSFETQGEIGTYPQDDSQLDNEDFERFVIPEQNRNWDDGSHLEILFKVTKNADVWIKLYGKNGTGNFQLLFQDKLVNYVINGAGYNKEMHAVIPIPGWRYVERMEFFFNTENILTWQDNIVTIEKAFLKMSSADSMKYCSNLRYGSNLNDLTKTMWLDDLDDNTEGYVEPVPPPAITPSGDIAGEKACNEFGYHWTGSKCCGDDAREIYEDSQGGCWKGNYLAGNETLSDSTAQISYFWGAMVNNPLKIDYKLDALVFGIPTTQNYFSRPDDYFLMSVQEAHGKMHERKCTIEYAIVDRLFKTFCYTDRLPDSSAKISCPPGQYVIAYSAAANKDPENAKVKLIYPGLDSVEWIFDNTNVGLGGVSRWTGDLYVYCGMQKQKAGEFLGRIDFSESPQQFDLKNDYRFNFFNTSKPGGEYVGFDKGEESISLSFKNSNNQAAKLSLTENDFLIVETNEKSVQNTQIVKSENFNQICNGILCDFSLPGLPDYIITNNNPSHYKFYVVNKSNNEIPIGNQLAYTSSGSLRASVPQQILFYGGELWGCNLSEYYNVDFIEDVGICESKGAAFCAGKGGWSKDVSGGFKASERNTEKSTEEISSLVNVSDPNYSPASCCPASACWNGTSCVAHMDLGVDEPQFGQYSCINGEWIKTPPLYTWERDKTGFCPGVTDCLVEPSGADNLNYFPNLWYNASLITQRPRCVASNQYVADNFCNNTIWESRTKKMALQMLDLVETTGVTDDYVLYCDNYTNIFGTELSNDALQHIVGPVQLGVVLPFYSETDTMITNNFCILDFKKSIDLTPVRVMGTSLNIPVNNTQFGVNYLYALGMSDPRYCDGTSGNDVFNKCSNDDTTWYASSLNAVMVSSSSIDTSGLTFVQTIVNWFTGIWNWITGQPQEASQVAESYGLLENSSRVQFLFIKAVPGKRVMGLVEDINGTRFALVQYTNFTVDMCTYTTNSINARFAGQVFEESPFLCNQTGTDYNIFINENLVPGIWRELTAGLTIS